MKGRFRTILSIAALAAAVGCAKNDVISSPSKSREMGFTTYLANKGVTKDAFIVGDQFAVMATMSKNPWTNLDANWYMGDADDPANAYVTVTKSPGFDDGIWRYSPIKLWPNEEKVSFFAFSPVPVEGGASFGISDVTVVKGSPTIKFEVDADIKSQVDLLRAEALNKFEEEVQLSFSHALTRVSFAAKANVTGKQMVRLDKIELVGIKNTGTLKLYDEARVVGANSDLGGWTAQAGSKSYVPALSHEVVTIVPATLTPMTQDDQAMFMIPQQFAKGGAAKLKVEYSFSNDGGIMWVNNSKFEIDLGAYTEYWNPSKNYRYVLTLSPDNVYNFSPDIVDWEADIDVNVKNPLSVTSLKFGLFGGVQEAVVTETRGQALGYTLKSNADWLKITDKADGSGAVGEVVYNIDGTVTKAYEMDKKWYVVLPRNTTNAAKSGYIELLRKDLEPVKLNIEQEGLDPFGSCPVWANSGTAGGVFKVTGLATSPNGVYTQKLTTAAGWYTMSLDGIGAGVKSLAVSSSTTEFYVHVPAYQGVARSANISLEVSEGLSAPLVAGTYKISQDEGTPIITLDKTSQAGIPWQGSTYTVKVTSNAPWSTSSTVSGVTFAPASGGAGTGISVTITVPEETTGAARSISAIFTATIASKQATATWIGAQAASQNTVTIAGTKWAKRNLTGSAGSTSPSFAANPQDYGMFFKWGDRWMYGRASSSTDGTWTTDTSDASTSPSSSGTGGTGYDYVGLSGGRASGDPCRALGAAYKTPTHAQWVALNNTGSKWGTYNGINGRFFGANYNSCTNTSIATGCIFIPAAGRRFYYGGSLDLETTGGYYWSSSVISSTFGYYCYFSSGSVNPDNNSLRGYGFSVRCVAE